LYSTSPYASAHLAALILSRWFGLPWVADFRDPWSGNPFRESANPWLSRWDAFLERMVLRFAGHIVCNTPTAAAKMIQRYAWVSAKCTTILNGFDFEALTGIEPIRTAPPDQFVFTHCGQFYGRRDPSIWFQALGRIRADAPHIANRIRFVSIGRPDYDGTPLSAIAAKYGVADLLECPGSHSHAETIGRMLGSDALILAGSSGDGSELQIPNKLFEYLAAQRPIIATACPQNPIREVLAQAKADHVVCDPLDVAGLAAAIASISKPGRPIASTAWTGFSQFSRRQCALELSTLFERLARVRKDSKAQATKAGRSHSGPIKSAHIETPSSRPWNFAAAQPN
jgi:glycosyltransferase involved in cell wall biosynthesis